MARALATPWPPPCLPHALEALLVPRRQPCPPPRPLTLSPSSSLPLALSRAATEHTRRRRRASPRPPSTPCLSDEFRGTAIAFCVFYTNPFDRGSPVASSRSSSPTFGRRRTSEDSRAPAPPRPRRCLYRIRCELLFHFPSSPRSFPHASRPFHRGRELLAAGDDADKARATGASYRARQRAPHLTRNLTHTPASPPVPPNANPDLARTPATAASLPPVSSGHLSPCRLHRWMRASPSST